MFAMLIFPHPFVYPSTCHCLCRNLKPPAKVAPGARGEGPCPAPKRAAKGKAKAKSNSAPKAKKGKNAKDESWVYILDLKHVPGSCCFTESLKWTHFWKHLMLKHHVWWPAAWNPIRRLAWPSLRHTLSFWSLILLRGGDTLTIEIKGKSFCSCLPTSQQKQFQVSPFFVITTQLILQ